MLWQSYYTYFRIASRKFCKLTGWRSWSSNGLSVRQTTILLSPSWFLAASTLPPYACRWTRACAFQWKTQLCEHTWQAWMLIALLSTNLKISLTGCKAGVKCTCNTKRRIHMYCVILKSWRPTLCMIRIGKSHLAITLSVWMGDGADIRMCVELHMYTYL